MGNKVSQSDNNGEEVQPVLSNAFMGDESHAGNGYSSARRTSYGTNDSALPNGAPANRRSSTSSRSYQLKTERKSNERVMRVPFSYNASTNGYSSLQDNDDQYEEEARRRALANRVRYLSRLDSRPDSSLAMPDHVVPDDFMVRVLIPVRGKQSSILTIFVFWNTMMGTSLLSMPWAIQQAGFIGGITLLLLMPFIMCYTAYLVLKSVDLEPGKEFNEFSDVCEHFLGKITRHMATLSSLVTLLGGVIVYWILLSSFLYNIVMFIYNKASPSSPHNHTDFSSLDQHSHFLYGHSNSSNPYSDVVCTSSSNSNTTAGESSGFEKFWRVDLTVPLILTVPLMLLVNFKSAEIFTKINSLGVVSMMFLTVFAIVKASKWGIHLELGTHLSSADPDYISDFKWTFPALTGISTLAYFVHNGVITITRNQKHPENNVRDLCIGYVLVAVTYIFIGTLIYVAFPLAKSCFKDNFLNNISTDDVMAFIAQIMMYFQMTCVFPLLTFIIRSQLLKELFDSVWPSFKHVFVLNTILFSICVVFAIFMPHIGRIIGFVGAFCGLVYAITLPCLVHMVAQHKRGQFTWGSLCLHGFLICFGVSNFISQFLILGKTS